MNLVPSSSTQAHATSERWSEVLCQYPCAALLGSGSLRYADAYTNSTLTSLDVQGLSFNVPVDLNGLARFDQVPAGNYAWRAEAAGFHTKAGTAVIEPGMTNRIEAVLPTAMVSYEWSVTPTTIVDKYDIRLALKFRTDVPAPAIVVEPPLLNLAMEGGQSLFTQITITNKGFVSAFNYRLGLSGDSAIQIQLPYDVIGEIKAGQSIVVPVKVTLAHASCHSASITGDFGYECPSGIDVTAAAPNVTLTAGKCGGGGGTDWLGGGSGGGGSFFTGTVGSGAMAVSVGAPTTAAATRRARGVRRARRKIPPAATSM